MVIHAKSKGTFRTHVSIFTKPAAARDNRCEDEAAAQPAARAFWAAYSLPDYRRGAIFLVGLLAMGAAAFLTANNLLFLIFSAMLAMLLVSGFLSRLVLSGLELELLLPPHVCARSETQARIRVRNLKRLTPSFSIELTGRRTGRVPIFSGAVYLAILPGGATAEIPIAVTFGTRGRHRESLFALSTRFPFGFIGKTATVLLRRETIVYPALELRGERDWLFDTAGARPEDRRRGSGLDFYRIRPYEPTDSARLVDWKSTAHTGRLQVREFARDEQGAVDIFFDRRARPDDYERFEQSIEDCASVIWSLAEEGVEVWVGAAGFAMEIPRDGDVYAALHYLALVEPLPHSAPPPEIPESRGRTKLVFSARPGLFEADGWLPGGRD